MFPINTVLPLFHAARTDDTSTGKPIVIFYPREKSDSSGGALGISLRNSIPSKNCHFSPSGKKLLFFGGLGSYFCLVISQNAGGVSSYTKGDFDQN